MPIAAPTQTLIQRNPIKAAIQLADSQAGPVTQTTLEEDETLLAQLQQIEATLLPIEKAGIAHIRAKKAETQNRIRVHKSGQKAGKYRRFSLEPLSWRNAEGYPRLVAFSLEDPGVAFKVQCQRNIGWRDETRYTKSLEPKLPKHIVDCYSDVLETLAKKARESKKTVTLSTMFNALIPLSIKAHIEEAKPSFKQIMVVAEVTTWDLKKTAMTVVNKDPLVIGWDGVETWLIDSFDATSLEEYVKQEFTTKP